MIWIYNSSDRNWYTEEGEVLRSAATLARIETAYGTRTKQYGDTFDDATNSVRAAGSTDSAPRNQGPSGYVLVKDSGRKVWFNNENGSDLSDVAKRHLVEGAYGSGWHHSAKVTVGGKSLAPKDCKHLEYLHPGGRDTRLWLLRRDGAHTDQILKVTTLKMGAVSDRWHNF